MADAPSPAPYDDWADLYDKVYAYLDYDLAIFQALGEPFAIKRWNVRAVGGGNDHEYLRK